MVFDHDGNEVGRHQLEHEQILPRAGWVEHDPLEIWERTKTVIGSCLTGLHLTAADIDSIGITNQRETTVVWDRSSGRPYTNAIVWQDTRTDSIVKALDADGRGDTIRQRAGLVRPPYFSGGKVQWMLENVDGLRTRRPSAATPSSAPSTPGWSGTSPAAPTAGSTSPTSPTPAARCSWTSRPCSGTTSCSGSSASPARCSPRSGRRATRGSTGIPRAGVRGTARSRSAGRSATSTPPRSVRSASRPATRRTPTAPATSCCSTPAREIVRSHHGLLTTVAYQLGDAKPVYALEGSIAVTGSAVQWLRDQLGLIRVVRGRRDVRPAGRGQRRRLLRAGVLRAVRAVLAVRRPRRGRRAVAVQHGGAPGPGDARGDLLPDARRRRRDGEDSAEAGRPLDLRVLKVDGGVTANDLCMQIQADVLGVEVSRPVVARDDRPRRRIRCGSGDRVLA